MLWLLGNVHHPDAGRTQRTIIVLTEPGADAAAAELIVEAWMKADESYWVDAVGADETESFAGVCGKLGRR
jgi:hypothetical protein